MENETDESLVTYMGFHAEERETAEAAAGELFRRHSRKLTAWCTKNFLLYKQNHEELVQHVFKKALKGAKAFLPQLAEHVEPAQKTKVIKCWLYLILKHLCIDAWHSEDLEREARANVDVENIQAILDTPDSEAAEIPTSRRIELTRQFVGGLNERDQAILFNTMQFYAPGVEETVMPESVLNDLCKELSLNPISLRTQRCRLLKRLRQHIIENE
jgi:DNA-directed RNA polymerase specialized sigma24 family protein